MKLDILSRLCPRVWAIVSLNRTGARTGREPGRHGRDEDSSSVRRGGSAGNWSAINGARSPAAVADPGSALPSVLVDGGRRTVRPLPPSATVCQDLPTPARLRRAKSDRTLRRSGSADLHGAGDVLACFAVTGDHLINGPWPSARSTARKCGRDQRRACHRLPSRISLGPQWLRHPIAAGLRGLTARGRPDDDEDNRALTLSGSIPGADAGRTVARGNAGCFRLTARCLRAEWLKAWQNCDPAIVLGRGGVDGSRWKSLASRNEPIDLHR